jgi:hypothetical protein
MLAQRTVGEAGEALPLGPYQTPADCMFCARQTGALASI